MEFLVADLCDQFEAEIHRGVIRVLPPVFHSYGGGARFCGVITTLRALEDNTSVRPLVAEPGQGRVLVIDGGGSTRCALVGDQIAAIAEANAWAGIIVDGAVRDSDALRRCNLGVLARATHPLRSQKRAPGERDRPVQIVGVWVRPGEWVYADSDGVIISPSELIPE